VYFCYLRREGAKIDNNNNNNIIIITILLLSLIHDLHYIVP